MIYVDCINPSNSITANQAYVLIRKLVAGFRAAGLQKGDVVCIHSFNNVRLPSHPPHQASDATNIE